ncbi:uncharacterized protein isoform X1 [Choristoneura fumiferana]|uniref:uncharacterized protein isoform X1 n=1 Tax=Choristoneura fumiferana TaxID=7141 RepID=UPI003D15603C
MAKRTANFEKADSRNLPLVDNVMILEFMTNSSNHNIAEIRGAKALMSSRDSYLSSAVGYVEVQRSLGICIVKARIVPEHRTQKSYTVMAKIRETDAEILESNCSDCAASAGGCKHSLLLLFWLEKQSCEPSCTSTQCFWIKPTLGSERTKHVLAEDVYKNVKKIKMAPRDPTILQTFYEQCVQRDAKGSLICNLQQQLKKKTFNLFDMSVDFFEKESNHDFEYFKDTLDHQIGKDDIEKINQETANQVNSKYWHYIRQGRLTASKLYEAAHCKTDGTLVRQILGGYKVPETKAIKRGKVLEKPVIEEIEKKLHIKVESSGFILINSLMGASPDGVTKDYVIEIKCPITAKTFQSYVTNNEISAKYKAQINLQMKATSLKKGIFCVADPLFETTKKVHIYPVDFDEPYINDLISKAESFLENFYISKNNVKCQM